MTTRKFVCKFNYLICKLPCKTIYIFIVLYKSRFYHYQNKSEYVYKGNRAYHLLNI